MAEFNFQKEVIDKSFEVPVVVDYWSPTCGPCLFLGPVLEKLEGESEGKWELAKVNTMENQQLAWEHGISSIPHVKMYYKGEVVSEFVGALPEGTLLKWLDEFLPNEQKEMLKAIWERIHGDDRDAAMAELEKFVEDYPDIDLGRLYLALQVVFNDPERGLELISTINMGDILYESSEIVRILAELMGFDAKGANGAASALEAASRALKGNDFDLGLEKLIEAVEIDKKIQGELPRRGTIAVLRTLGPSHPLTTKYRRKFEMALY